MGLSVPRRRSGGGRRSAPLPLDRDAILRELGPAAGIAVEVVDIIDSTNSELARRAARGDVDRQVLAAERQTAGRGRRGRSWTAVPGGSLTFSLGWRFEQGAAWLSGLTLGTGLAVAQALEAAGFDGVALKWPNDLVIGGAKLGGILVELSGDALGPSLAIIGVGLNVRLPAAERRAIAQPVADLASIAGAGAIDRNALLARVLSELAAMLERYAAGGFAPLRAAWQRRHVLQGKPVRILRPDGSAARGRVTGVDADGALVLESDGRRLRVVSGEASLARRER